MENLNKELNNKKISKSKSFSELSKNDLEYLNGGGSDSAIYKFFKILGSTYTHPAGGPMLL